MDLLLASAPPNLRTDASTSFLSSLLALPLAQLTQLPAHHTSILSQLDADLASLAYARYPAFLLAHQASSSLSSSFSALDASLASLVDAGAALQDASLAFEKRVAHVQDERDRLSAVQERQEEIEHLLDAPALVDSCVKAGLWSEAVDVAERLDDLAARYEARRDTPQKARQLLDRVRGEVRDALSSLRTRVLESLVQRGLKLPGAVRAVGILRRLNESSAASEESSLQPPQGKSASKTRMTEPALRVAFLSARTRCLAAELAPLVQLARPTGLLAKGHSTLEENEEATRALKRYIEVWREVVGETAGIYADVFLSSSSSSSSTVASTSAAPTALNDALAPLHLFLRSSLTRLANALDAQLPGITATASLSSILTQLSYCSHSFARYGLDFREPLGVLNKIESRLAGIVQEEWAAAAEAWEGEWREATRPVRAQGNAKIKGKAQRQALASWLTKGVALTPQAAQHTLDSVAAALEKESDISSSAGWHHLPQPLLASFPPLARLLNAHAAALNALRLLPCIGVYATLRHAQAEALAGLARTASEGIAKVDVYVAPVLPETGDDEEEEERARDASDQGHDRAARLAVRALKVWVAPWLRGALRKGVYPELEVPEGESDGDWRAVLEEIEKERGWAAKVQVQDPEHEVIAPSPPAAPELDAPAALEEDLPVNVPDTLPTEKLAAPLEEQLAVEVEVSPPDAEVATVEAGSEQTDL